MRVELKPETVSKIEELTGQRMTTRCDRIINQALDIASNKTSENLETKPQVKMAPGILEALKDG